MLPASSEDLQRWCCADGLTPQQLVVQGAVQLVADETHQPTLLIGVIVGQNLVSHVVQLHHGQVHSAPLAEGEM